MMMILSKIQINNAFTCICVCVVMNALYHLVISSLSSLLFIMNACILKPIEIQHERRKKHTQQRTLILAIVQTKIYNEIHRKHNDRYQFVLLFVIYTPTTLYVLCAHPLKACMCSICIRLDE